MKNTALKNIKYESIKSIFTAIATSEKISRARISDKTGLSIVTIGKIVDALVALDAVREVKEARQQAGRRAGVLSVNKSKYILILDITSYNFSFSLLDLSLSLIEKIDRRYISTVGYQDNIDSFFREALSHLNKHYSLDNCIGVGISLPAPYDSEKDCVRSYKVPEIVTLPILATAKRYFKDTVVFAESHVSSAARANLTKIDEYMDKSIIYFYISERDVCGAHLINGEVISGKGAQDFGNIRLDLDITLRERISVCKNESDCAKILAGVIYNLTKTVSPHTLIMEYDTAFSSDNLNNLIKDTLLGKYRLSLDDMPEFITPSCQLRNSHSGIALSICEMWLKSLIFGEI